MSNFNINNPPGGPYNNQTNIVAWLVTGLQTLWRRVSGVSGSSGNATNNLIPLLDYYSSVGNVGTTETDLYSDTIAANTLATDGDKLEFIYSGTMAGAANSIIRVYFGGGVAPIYESGPQGGGHDWVITGSVIRVSSTVIRYSVSLYGADIPTASPAIEVNEKTGLTLSDGNILKISVECTAPATPNDSAIAVLGTVKWISHA